MPVGPLERRKVGKKKGRKLRSNKYNEGSKMEKRRNEGRKKDGG